MTHEELIELFKSELTYDSEKATELFGRWVYDEDLITIIKALEKQKPKKPIREPVHAPDVDSHKVRAWYDICPICHRGLVMPNPIGMKDDKYCGECGQAIDWSDYND